MTAMPMPVQGIIFDKDGTLFDFQSTWAPPIRVLIERLADESGHADVAEAIGFDLSAGRFRPDSVAIAGTSSELADVLSAVTGKPFGFVLDVLDEIGGSAMQAPAVPLRACLGALKAMYVLGLVTNDTEAPARAHLAQEGVLELFDFVAGYDSGFGAKPGPGQLLAFCEATGLTPDQTIMVGDSRHDLSAGRAANMRTVGVLTGVAARAELVDLADVILPDIGHLAAWLADGTVPA